MPEEARRSLESLSEGQLNVLARVAEYKSSKEIARELGISPNTVDQRLKRVQAILGVGGRFDAARLYRAAYGDLPQPEQACGDLVYQAPGLATPATPADQESSPVVENRTGDGSATLHQAQAAYAVEPSWTQPPTRFPALLGGRSNELGPLARAVAILGLTLLAFLSFAAAVALAEGMSRLF